VIEGEGAWSKKVWYGVKRFFAWLETRAYKMHVRVLLSRYRAYTPCSVCDGARLKTEALLWRVGDKALADATLGAAPRFRPQGVEWSAAQLAALPGLSIHDLVLLPVERSHAFFQQLQLPRPLDEATDLLLGEIRGRFRYLADVGLGYLTLDRQSRTLSGGEVQRINLTTALGTSLVNTLFVLDEPSIGLHPRDMQRVIGVMKRLRDAGNSLVVVEHDPQIMLEADRILDLGPGAGERGGEIVFFGSTQAIRGHQASLTGQYLSGSKSVTPARAPATRAPASAGGVVAEARSNRWLELKGACEHNLKNVDVRIPLKRLVCVTGVSGSGKSTLVEDVLYPALLKYRGKPTEAPGQFAGLAGAELIDDVVMVDQNPIGRTTRSNPASYVGAFDAIRALPAAEPAAQERKYTPAPSASTPATAAAPPAAAMARARGDAVPLGRVPALPGLRRKPLSRGGARRAPRGRGRPPPEHRAGAAADRDRGARLLRRHGGSRRAPGTAGGCRPGVPETRPAGPDALGRRGAAPEARRTPGASRLGALQHHAPRQAVPV
jgi:excinuclease ABC subunit A